MLSALHWIISLWHLMPQVGGYYSIKTLLGL
jgi:hypothetical protein